MTVAEKTLLLKQDFDDVKQAGRFNPIISSKNLNGNVSGVAIAVNDVIDMGHEVDVRLGSKNLFDPRNYVDTSNQGTVIILDDGLVELDGNLDMENGGTYAEITYNFIVTEPCVLTLRFEENYGGKVNAYLNDTSLNLMNETTISVPLFVGTHKLRLWQGEQSRSGTYIQLEIGTTATEYTPYIENLGGIEVSRYEKNLFDQDTELPKVELIHPDYSNYIWTKQADGSFYSGNIGTMAGGKWWKNTNGYTGQMSLCFTAKTPNDDTGRQGLAISFVYTDDTKTSVYVETSIDYKTYTLTSAVGKTVSYIRQSYQNYGSQHYIKDVMIAYGTDVNYKPYVEPTIYQSASDGTVKGITSIAPNMTLLSNNNGVVINAHYYKDPDIVISNLQQSVALSGGE